MTSSKFDELYKKLNPEQRGAVDTIDGPVIVIAGPGTGKTSILTLRISNILRLTDTAPESILVLTFTESGVHSVRKKLVDIIGTAGYRVPIYTFHSFCNDIIKGFPQEFPRIIGAQHVTDVDQISIIEELILKTKLVALKPHGNPVFYLKSILNFIKELKREDVGADEYKKYVDDFEKDIEDVEDLRHTKGAYKGEIKAKYKPTFRKIENSREFGILYEKYQNMLEEKRLYDYEDMIIEVLRELRENKNLLLELQETYQYILADEHQDANRGQNRLLELLSGFHKEPNLFVVGDEKQAIFRFQGASLENFLYFKKRFPNAKVFSLNKNYRSTQGILDASHSLIEKNPAGGIERVRLESKGTINEAEKNKDVGNSAVDQKANITIYECDTPQAEAIFIAKKVLEKIETGVAGEDIVVLFRDNRDADELARIFDTKSVPYVLHTDIDVIADEQIQKLFCVLKAINEFGNDKLLSLVLFLDFFELSHLDVFKILRYGYENRRNLVGVIKSMDDLVRAGVEEPKKFTDLYHMLHEMSVVARNKGLIDSIQIIVARIGFVGFILSKPRSLELVSAYDALLSHVVELIERHKGAKLQDYIGFLGKMSTHGISVRAKSISSYPGRVNLMTAHKSKGLEFDHVFCAHLNEGHWGGRKNISYFLPIDVKATDEVENNMADERRLLYVAMTRARKTIVLTYATHRLSGKEILPSRFIEEIDPALVELKKEKGDTLALLEKIEKHTENFLDIKNREYLEKVFLEQGFSVSALNNYLTCPWKYFFQNLLRVPRVEERHQLYGTAIHETLKVFFDAYKNDNMFSKKVLLGFFEKYLNRKALSESDYQLFLDKGRKSLGGYFDTYKDTWPKNIFNEFNVSGVHLPFEMADGTKSNVLLRGQLDKVEILDGNSVNVVDYKTGNPKSRNDILGETKNSEGNYKRQLVFYKLIIDNFEKGRFNMNSGSIDFIEPAKNGKYRCEKFEVTDAEVKELVDVIKKSALEIISLSFWQKKCEDTECEFCAMKKLIV